jgi:hypothetical protein
LILSSSRNAVSLFVGNNAGSSGDFADSLAVFAAPKDMGLKSYIRLSGVLIKSLPITSSDSFNASSAGIRKARWGWIDTETPFSAISRSNWSPDSAEVRPLLQSAS